MLVEEKALCKTKDALGHKKALLDALGNPSLYDFTGDVVDAGKGSISKCACGHPIRWEYIIEHRITNQRAKVGSTCIEHFQFVNPELYEKLTEAVKVTEEEIKEIKRKAKKAENQEKVQKAKKEYEQLATEVYNRYQDYRNRGEYAPYELWWAATHNCGNCKKTYKTARRYINWYNRQAKTLQNFLGRE